MIQLRFRDVIIILVVNELIMIEQLCNIPKYQHGVSVECYYLIYRNNCEVIICFSFRQSKFEYTITIHMHICYFSNFFDHNTFEFK